MTLPPGAQPVVEHHPRAPERPRQRLPLTRRRIEAVVIPEPHVSIILTFLWSCTGYSHRPRIVSSSGAPTRGSSPATGTRSSPPRTWNAGRRSCRTCTQTPAGPARVLPGRRARPPAMHFLPTVATSRLVNSPNGVSSRRLPQESPDLRRRHRSAKRPRPGSNLARSAGSPPIMVPRQYIDYQDHPPDRLISGRPHHRPESRHTGSHPVADQRELARHIDVHLRGGRLRAEAGHVVHGEDRGRRLIAVEQAHGGAVTGVLGEVAGFDPDVLAKTAGPHGVLAAPLTQLPDDIAGPGHAPGNVPWLSPRRWPRRRRRCPSRSPRRRMGAGIQAEPVARAQQTRTRWRPRGQPGGTYPQQGPGTWPRRARVTETGRATRAGGQRAAPGCDPGQAQAQDHLPRSTARPTG